MKTPLLTIAIPAYNHQHYISHTIASILKQTFLEFELLIVDDSSTDDTVKVIKEFNDPRIKLIELEKNLGMCGAGNVCIENAQGEYISLIASDDIMHPTKIEKQINFLQNNPEYGAVFSCIEVIDADGNFLPKKTKRFEKYFTNQNRSRGEWLNHFFYKGNCIAAPTFMSKTSILREIGGFDPRLSQAHDFDMWVKICLHGHNIYVLNEKLVQYRTRCGNLSSNNSRMRKRLLFDNEKILQNYLIIKNVEDLIKIFPNLQNIKNEIRPELIPFHIAMEAASCQNSPYHNQFSLTVLYELLKKSENITLLNQNYNFTLKDFFNLIANNPYANAIEKIENSFCEKTLKKIKTFLGIK